MFRTKARAFVRALVRTFLLRRTDATWEPELNGPHATFSWIGGALDVGYQIALEHFLLGFGGGVQVRTGQRPPYLDGEHAAYLLLGAPVKPRILFALGYVFR